MLSAAAIAKAKPKEKDYVLFDGDHLYLRVYPSGKKAWSLRYMVDGKMKKATIGLYPDLSLGDARRKRDDWLSAARNGHDAPVEERTFSQVASEWLARRQPTLTERYLGNLRQRLDAYIIPSLGSKLMKDITRPQLVRVITELFDSGREETAIRTAGILENIFAFALNAGQIDTSPAQYLSSAVPDRTKNVKHMRSTSDPEGIALVMKALSDIDSFQTRHALQIVAYTAVRVGELLRAEMAEFDLKAHLWTVPEEHMKKRKELLVPMSAQVARLISEVFEFNAKFRPRSKLLFPALNPRKAEDSAITEAALLKALKVMCWTKPGTPAMTIHGFRSMASSVLNEHGWNPDAIERQLAHVPQGVRGIYNRAEYLDIRTEMMQWYSDYLDALRDGRPTPNVSKNATLMRL